MARAPVALSKVFTEKGSERVRLLTPPDPDTGKDVRIFDVLDWIHAVTTQIPDPRQHLQRYYGAYSNRARRLYRASNEGPTLPAEGAAERTDDEGGAVAVRRAWARLLRRIYEVDPLVCPRCGTELRIVAVITDPDVVDRILGHRARRGLRSPFEPRAPPAA